jgi:hypothetical protein
MTKQTSRYNSKDNAEIVSTYKYIAKNLNKLTPQDTSSNLRLIENYIARKQYNIEDIDIAQCDLKAALRKFNINQSLYYTKICQLIKSHLANNYLKKTHTTSEEKSNYSTKTINPTSYKQSSKPDILTAAPAYNISPEQQALLDKYEYYLTQLLSITKQLSKVGIGIKVPTLVSATSAQCTQSQKKLSKSVP